MRPELGGDGLGPAKYTSLVDVTALVLKGEDRVAAVMPDTDGDIRGHNIYRAGAVQRHGHGGHAG